MGAFGKTVIQERDMGGSRVTIREKAPSCKLRQQPMQRSWGMNCEEACGERQQDPGAFAPEIDDSHGKVLSRDVARNSTIWLYICSQANPQRRHPPG